MIDPKQPIAHNGSVEEFPASDEDARKLADKIMDDAKAEQPGAFILIYEKKDGSVATRIFGSAIEIDALHQIGTSAIVSMLRGAQEKPKLNG